jgi:hypothetical protein
MDEVMADHLAPEERRVGYLHPMIEVSKVGVPPRAPASSSLEVSSANRGTQSMTGRECASSMLVVSRTG